VAHLAERTTNDDERFVVHRLVATLLLARWHLASAHSFSGVVFGCSSCVVGVCCGCWGRKVTILAGGGCW
jgi:hypothetical protein